MAGLRFMAHGTTIEVDSVQLSGVVSISLPSRSRGEAEITDGDSNFAREFVAGLVDGGTVDLELRFIPGDAGQQVLIENMGLASAVVEVVVTLPSQATDDSAVGTIIFDAFVNGDGGNLPLADDEAASYTASLRVSGTPTYPSV